MPDIVVFGSINLDLVFAMDELPLPGQTRLASSFSMQPGGKGANQAVAARRDGAMVHMVGAVGDDALAPLALRLMMEAGVSLAATRRIPGASTGCASIGTDAHGRNQIAVALGANEQLRAIDLPEALLVRDSWLVAPMEADSDQVASAIVRARRAGMTVLLNLAPFRALPRSVLQQVDLLVVNEDEAEELARHVACEATAAALHQVLSICVVRTLGAKGAEAACREGAFRCAAPSVQAVDSTAAGDCFVGTLASAAARLIPLPAAMERACSAAALACTVRGSQQSLPTAAAVDKTMQ